MRSDIQTLRGFAVLLVVVYHVWPQWIPAGYLGVDIFFVISGYLITKGVAAGIGDGSFRFREFYARRMRRLLPASYAVLLLTAVLSVVLLTGRELRDFGGQVLGAVTFSANVVLWKQTGYFAGTAEMKPLLHLWSLAIEEQYYLLLPVTLELVPRRYWMAGAWVIFGVSLGLCVWMVLAKPVAAFYLLPARAWELAVGSIGALWVGQWRGGAFYWPGVAALAVVPFAPLGRAHPGVDAVIVCVATLLVVLRQGGLRGLGWFGDCSYSLYLVHWPLFVFVRTVWMGPIPLALQMGETGAAIGLGYALYRWVERPVRAMEIGLTPKVAAAVVAASLVLVAIPIVAGAGGTVAPARQPNYGLGQDCEYVGDFAPKPACRTREAPGILVWGDSFAMQHVPGIMATSGERGVVQATRSTCGPFLGLAPVSREAASPYTRQWAEECTDFNASVLRYLEQSDSVQTVVLSAALGNYVSSEKLVLRDRGELRAASADEAMAALRRTVGALQRLGKRAVWIAPPPAAEFDIGLCNERRAAGLLTVGPHADCVIQLGRYREEHAELLAFLERMQREAVVELIRLDRALCDKTVCKTWMDGESLYLDTVHLRPQASVWLARRLEFATRLGSPASPSVR